MEFSASVGLIHKESVTMHGHTIVKDSVDILVTWGPPLNIFNWLVRLLVTDCLLCEVRTELSYWVQKVT